MQLFPDTLEDLIDSGNPVRILDAFVDSLDLERLGFLKAVPKETGRPSYDPRILLKLYVYGYFNKVRSSRKLMLEAARNIELFYLLGRLQPDFRTIADFRKDNTQALQQVFRTFAAACLDLGLYRKTLFAVDGTKIRAVNSKRNAYNQKTLMEKLDRLDQHIEKYLRDLDGADADEEDAPKYTKEEILEKLEQLKKRRDKYQDYRNQLTKSGESQILTTDPEAKVMESKDGYHCYYNVQTSVDEGSHLIAEYDVTDHCTDQGLLKAMADKTRRAMHREVIEVVADRGYESRKDIENCVQNGIVPNVAMKYDKKHRVHMLPYMESEITEEIFRSEKPEDIRSCLHAGIMPKCYEGSCLSLEVLRRDTLSCFSKNPDGTVSCPTGKCLYPVRKKGKNTLYRSREACRDCLTRCTSSGIAKDVSFGPTTEYVPVMMYGNSDKTFAPLPQGIQKNPYNHNLDRQNFKKQVVRLIIKSDREKLQKRMCLVEHPFGTVKWYHGAHYLLCRGKNKAAAEMGLSFLAYNLKRAIALAGSELLLEYLQSHRGMLAADC